MTNPHVSVEGVELKFQIVGTQFIEFGACRPPTSRIVLTRLVSSHIIGIIWSEEVMDRGARHSL